MSGDIDDPRARAEALATDLDDLLRRQIATLDGARATAEMSRDYDLAFERALRKHGARRTSTVDLLCVGCDGWYVQFRKARWRAIWSPTGYVEQHPAETI